MLFTIILAPGAGEVGLGAAALAPHFAWIVRRGAAGAEFREITLYAQAAYLRAIYSELDVQFVK